jgi:hypothetical protein
MAGNPGACKPLIGIGNGGAGSALATGWPLSVSVADAPSATSNVLIDDMTLPVISVVPGVVSVVVSDRPA